MSRKTMLGLFGGVLVAIAVFITNSGIAIDMDELAGSVALVQLVAGLGVILFLLVRQHTWALYFAIAATTIGALALVDVFRASGPGINLGFVVLMAGVVLVLVGTVRRTPEESDAEADSSDDTVGEPAATDDE